MIAELKSSCLRARSTFSVVFALRCYATAVRNMSNVPPALHATVCHTNRLKAAESHRTATRTEKLFFRLLAVQENKPATGRVTAAGAARLSRAVPGRHPQADALGKLCPSVLGLAASRGARLLVTERQSSKVGFSDRSALPRCSPYRPSENTPRRAWKPTRAASRWFRVINASCYRELGKAFYI